MPSVSVKQRKFFGFLKGNPDEAKKRGISGRVVDEFASTKEKGLPMKVDKGEPDEDDVKKGKKKGFSFPRSRKS